MRMVLALALLSMSASAYAYIGPGLGLGVVGALVGGLLALTFAVIGVVWYPLKRLTARAKGGGASRRPATDDGLRTAVADDARDAPAAARASESRSGRDG